MPGSRSARLGDCVPSSTAAASSSLPATPKSSSAPGATRLPCSMLAGSRSLAGWMRFFGHITPIADANEAPKPILFYGGRPPNAVRNDVFSGCKVGYRCFQRISVCGPATFGRNSPPRCLSTCQLPHLLGPYVVVAAAPYRSRILITRIADIMSDSRMRAHNTDDGYKTSHRSYAWSLDKPPV